MKFVNSLILDDFEIIIESSLCKSIDDLNAWYLICSPNINRLMTILSKEASEMVICPREGEWRCAAIFPAKKGYIAIFFPWISGGKSCKLDKSIVFGRKGIVELEEILEAAQKVCGFLKEEKKVDFNG